MRIGYGRRKEKKLELEDVVEYRPRMLLKDGCFAVQCPIGSLDDVFWRSKNPSLVWKCSRYP
jgi:hypothetical protein